MFDQETETVTPEIEEQAELQELFESLGNDYRKINEIFQVYTSGAPVDLDMETFKTCLAFIVSGKDGASRAKTQLNEFQAVVKAAQMRAKQREHAVRTMVGDQRLIDFILRNANKGKQTVVTPYGSASVKKSSGGPQKADEDALRDALMREGMTEFLKPQPPAIDWAALKKRLTETGEDLDGVNFQPASAAVSFGGPQS